MPVHDWTRVPAGVFHDFHQTWTCELSHTLNRGTLPSDYYSLISRTAPLARLNDLSQGPIPVPDDADEESTYAAMASVVTVRQPPDHRVIAVVAVVSPGDRTSPVGRDRFVGRSVEWMQAGVQLLVIDLFPPTAAVPNGVHAALWTAWGQTACPMPTGEPLTLASYAVRADLVAYLEPTAVGRALPDMPLFIAPDRYVNVPLEATYQAAWGDVPPRWQRVVG